MERKLINILVNTDPYYIPKVGEVIYAGSPYNNATIHDFIKIGDGVTVNKDLKVVSLRNCDIMDKISNDCIRIVDREGNIEGIIQGGIKSVRSKRY